MRNYVISAAGVGWLWLVTVNCFAQELSKEYLEQWTPSGDTNAPDLPYPHRFAPYERETDDDWVDDRWQHTEKGPFVSHSIRLPDQQVGKKLTAVDLGAKRYLLYDLEQGGFVAGVLQGSLRIKPARFGLLQMPSLEGQLAFSPPDGSLWTREGSPQPMHVDYQGLYLHNRRVLFETLVDGVTVLESAFPASESDVIVREIELDPHEHPLLLHLAKAVESLVVDEGNKASWSDADGKRHSLELHASPGMSLTEVDGSLRLHMPPSNDRTYGVLTYSCRGSDTAKTIAWNQLQKPELSRLKQPGEGRWGEPLRTRGVVSDQTDQALVVDRIGVPHDNRYGALFFLAGLAFFDNGDAAVSTAHGDIWVVRGLDSRLEDVTWQRFATGLYQPLGVEIVDGKVLVLGRDQLTLLHDMNGDGEADFYESFNHDLRVQGSPHAYAMRLDRAPDGGFYFLKSGAPPHGSALLHVSRDGADLDVVARGFRHPFGLGVGPNGWVTVADNEGNWVPSSKIDVITPGEFYGYVGSAKSELGDEQPARPLCYIPKVADNASGGQVWNTSHTWCPSRRDEMFHFSWGRCTLHAVLRQQVGDTWQAATIAVPKVQCESGPAEAAFHPLDGQLYVVGLDGWLTAAQADGCFERIRWTGQELQLPDAFSICSDGLTIRFPVPLDPAAVESVDNFAVSQWNYKRSEVYGSYHYSVKDPSKVGHDRVAIDGAELLADGKTVKLRITGMHPVDQLQVTYDLQDREGIPITGDLYATINAVPTTPAEDYGRSK